MDKREIYNGLLEFLSKDKIRLNESMKRNTTFKIGGPVDFLVVAENENDLILTYKYAIKNNIPFYIIGNGSNLLVKDNGIRGIVVKNRYDEIKILKEYGDGNVDVQVSSGVSINKFSKFLLENEFTGFEFAHGIPGTIGGAIRMNAGAFGGEMKDIVKESTYLTSSGEKKHLNNSQHEFEYRKSIISKEGYILLNSVLRFKKGNKLKIKEKMDENITLRISNQPVNMPSAGSTFKRGEGFITSKIIDEIGLKGYKIGGAEVSKKHAGFIINSGDATAKNVIELIDYVKSKVKIELDKDLETEIVIIGE